MNEIVIVGGGLAGAAAAIHLARAGRDVTLIEKEAVAHDKICGEFISHEAVTYVAALGVDLAALGAVPIDTVRFSGGAVLSTRKLPFMAQSLSRLVLDEALLTAAEAAGATVLRGVTVQRIEAEGSCWMVRTTSPLPHGRGRETYGAAVSRTGEGVLQTHSPPQPTPSPAILNHSAKDSASPMRERELLFETSTVFLASGKHDVRGLKRPLGKQNDLVGFKMHWRLSADQHAALGCAVELFVFPGGYGGLEPIEDGKANLCFLIQRAELERHSGQWDALLPALCAASPLLAQRLAGASPLWSKPLAISAIPYGYVRHDSDGLWRLGDQAAVIPSFSGDGMAIALHSARLASQFYLAGQSVKQYQARLASDVQRQVRLATGISRALVSPAGQPLCRLAAAWLPALMGAAAKATRIPDSVLAA